jgi:hypothetical protein
MIWLDIRDIRESRDLEAIDLNMFLPFSPVQFWNLSYHISTFVISSLLTSLSSINNQVACLF